MMAIEDQIKQYIAENLLFSDNGFGYDDDDSFIQKGIIDSVGVLELVAFVNKRFGVDVYDHEVTLDNFNSVNKLSNYIRKKVAVGDERTVDEKRVFASPLSA